LPTPQELDGMKNDLQFKEKEMQKSETTASGLALGNHSQSQTLSVTGFKQRVQNGI